MSGSAKVATLLGGDRLLWAEMERVSKSKKKGPVKIQILLFDAQRGAVISRAEDTFKSDVVDDALERLVGRRSLRRRSHCPPPPPQASLRLYHRRHRPHRHGPSGYGRFASACTAAALFAATAPIAGTGTGASGRFASTPSTGFAGQMTPPNCPYCHAPLPAPKPGTTWPVSLCQVCGRAVVTVAPVAGGLGANKHASSAKTMMWTGGLGSGMLLVRRPAGRRAFADARSCHRQARAAGSAASPSVAAPGMPSLRLPKFQH